MTRDGRHGARESPAYRPDGRARVVLGHHKVAWSAEVDVLLTLRHRGRLQPVRCRLSVPRFPGQ